MAGKIVASGLFRWNVGEIGRREHEAITCRCALGTPFHSTGSPLCIGSETNTGVGPNETKAIRGLVASTWSRRKRRMLTQVSRDLKGPGPVTTRLADTSGTLTRKASGSVYVVVPHPIMCLRNRRITGRMTGGLRRGYAESEGRRSVERFLGRSRHRKRCLARHPSVMNLAADAVTTFGRISDVADSA